MKKAKFNFVPERQLKEVSSSPSYRVSIYSNGQIIFPRDVVHIYELDGKFLRMYGDTEKKAIGWQVIEGKTEFGDINDARQIKADPKLGICRISVTKLLKHMGYSLNGSLLDLPVQTYKSGLHASDVYYIELPEKEADTPSNG